MVPNAAEAAARPVREAQAGATARVMLHAAAGHLAAAMARPHNAIQPSHGCTTINTYARLRPKTSP